MIQLPKIETDLYPISFSYLRGPAHVNPKPVHFVPPQPVILPVNLVKVTDGARGEVQLQGAVWLMMTTVNEGTLAYVRVHQNVRQPALSLCLS
jgi:hypothetical protein